mgnify:CR=1 FL=1
MKVIIASGRDYKFTDEYKIFLDSVLITLPITEVVCGDASGADKEGELWAVSHGLPVKHFPAEWNNFNLPKVARRTNKYGKEYNPCAGHCRNEQMALYADACILFKGGNGTANMRNRAHEHGLILHDVYRTDYKYFNHEHG